MGIRARIDSLKRPSPEKHVLATGPRPLHAATAVALVDDPLDEFPPEGALAPTALAPRTAAGSGAWRMRTWVGGALLAIATLGGGAAYALWPAGAVSTGALRIESDPANASVEIDGKARGATPLTLNLPAGRHAMTLVSGTRRRTLNVDIAANATIVHHVDLPVATDATAEDLPAVGTLLVTTSGPAEVSVDGTARGSAPLTLAGLTVGQHQVVIRSGGSNYQRTIKVEPGRTVSLVLGEMAGASPGWLRAQTPLPFTIAENGEIVGTTESDRVMMAAGDHNLEFSNAALGYRATQRVRIDAGKLTALTLRLPQAPVQINALPWAEVWIDGERVGETPLANVMQTIGPHEIVFRHPQLGERRVTTVVSLGTPARATVDMRTR